MSSGATDSGNAWSLWALTYHPHPYRYLPARARHYLVRRVLGPLGAWRLRDRFEGKVEVSEVARIVRAGATGGTEAKGALEVGRSGSGVSFVGGRPVLTVRELGGRTRELSADHVIAATG